MSSRKPDKIQSMLGLAARSRNLVSGETAVETAVKSGKAKLVIVPLDASDNTVHDFTNMCEYRNVPFYRYSTKTELGHTIGKDDRSSLAVTDRGFAAAILKLLDGTCQIDGGSSNNGKNESK